MTSPRSSPRTTSRKWNSIHDQLDLLRLKRGRKTPKNDIKKVPEKKEEEAEQEEEEEEEEGKGTERGVATIRRMNSSKG